MISKIQQTVKQAVIATILFAASIAYAQSAYSIGAVLTESQVARLGQMETINVGNSTYRILPGGLSNGGNVIDQRGKIGRCDPEVVISGIPIDQAQNALAAYQSLIVTTKVYDSLKMVSARFSNISAAAKARNEIAASIPGATVTLPIVFSVPRAN